MASKQWLTNFVLLIRLAHLDKSYMVPEAKNVPTQDCVLKQGYIYSPFTVFNTCTCLIEFSLSAQDMIFQVPDERKTFGLIPLQMKNLYRALHEGVQTEWKWDQGDIEDTRHFFSVVTPLMLDKTTVAEIKAEGETALRSILDSCKTSPVFVATERAMYMMTLKVGSDQQRSWQGTNIKGPRSQKPMSWTEKDFTLFSGATIIYSKEHVTLSKEVPLRKCVDGKSI